MTILELVSVRLVEGGAYNKVSSAISFSDKMKVTEYVRNIVADVGEGIRLPILPSFYSERERTMKKLLDAYRIASSL